MNSTLKTMSHPAANQRHVLLGMVLLTLVYVGLIQFTEPISWGDTGVYANEIARFSDGEGDGRLIWEFGHLIWRPLGYAVWKLGSPYWAEGFDDDKSLQLHAALRLPNLVLGFLGALAAFGVASQISGSVVRGTIIAVAFLSWNPYINYFQSGTAYVPGLAFLLAGLYLLLGDSSHPRPRWRAWLAGVLLALSVCLWFPYLFAVPGVLLLGYLWQRREPAWNGDESRRRLRWIGHAAAACALVGVLSYAGGALLARVGSASDFREWVSTSGHGYQPDKRYLRVATGLPRALVDLGDDGLMLKRFATRDPYAPVAVRAIVFSSGVWKIILFYLGGAALVWTLLRDRDSTPVVLPFVLSFGMMLFFAVFVFEPGQSERWLPMFPVLLVSVAFVFRRGSAMRVSALPVAAMLVAFWVSNALAYATPGEPGEENPAVSRILRLDPSLAPNSVVCLLSFRDGISVSNTRFPMHPLNRAAAARFYHVTEPGNVDSATWRERFAIRGLRAWRIGGDIWISKRLIAPEPLPAWGWTEADDPQLRWRDLPAFFEAFDFDGDVGGTDGFMRIARSASNQAHFEEVARESGELR